MRVQDMPEFRDKSHVLAFDEDTILKDAIQAMADKNYGACLVTRNDKLVGVFTERDLLRKVVPAGVDVKKKKLKDVMTKALKTAQIEDNVSDCLRRMSQGRFRHMPIVDQDKNILGMLSQGDFVAFTMSDIMNRFTTTAKANVSIGKSLPVSMVIAIMIYTIAILFLVSAFGHWFG
jgi:CBS domain-containing protein